LQLSQPGLGVFFGGVFLGDTECCSGGQQNGRQLPFRSQGDNDPRQKITPGPGWRNRGGNRNIFLTCPSADHALQSGELYLYKLNSQFYVFNTEK
jgi:hypothetical protein